MRFFVLGVIAVALLYGSYWLGTRRAGDWRVVKLREHSKYLRRARWASLTRRDGLANIYVEAAERVLELPESRRED